MGRLRYAADTSRLLTISLIVLCIQVVNSEFSEEGVVDHASSMIQWVRTKGGYVSDKVELRRMDPTDETSPMGMFATSFISKNETILKIPKSCYLGFDNTASSTDPLKEEWQVAYANEICTLSHRLMNEWAIYHEDPDRSDFAPYLAYLDSQPMGQIPATYSEEGKALLRKIVGEKSSHVASENYTYHMVDWIDDHFVNTNCISKDDKNAYHAVALSIQRGYDSELIPIWDMVNHDNGRLNVNTNSLRSEEGLIVWVSKDIDAGSEIFATYNYCENCHDIGDEWGTPGILRDFGFVEDYHQVWPFLEQGIWFVVDWDEEDDGKLVATYEKDEETGEVIYGLPDDKGLEFLRSELERLDKINLEQERHAGNIPKHEYDVIKKYYTAYRQAIGLGLEAAVLEKTLVSEEEYCQF